MPQIGGYERNKILKKRKDSNVTLYVFFWVPLFSKHCDCVTICQYVVLTVTYNNNE